MRISDLKVTLEACATSFIKRKSHWGHGVCQGAYRVQPLILPAAMVELS